MRKVGHHRAEMVMDTLLHANFIIIIITLCSRADSLSVSVPVSRLTAARGHTVVLDCEFSPNFEQNPDMSSLLVTWQRQEDNRVVHSFYYGKDQLDKQDSAYQNRTALFVTELSKGNASVSIGNVEVQDAGRYLCTVSTSQGTDKGDLQLDYGAFYTEPTLTISANSSDVLVQYETEGFPMPEVAWNGKDGSNLSLYVKTSMQLNESMGLYYITSSYTAPNTALNFTFSLRNQLLDQSLQRSICYSGQQKSCFNETCALAVVSLLLFGAAAALVCICYKKK